jgi:hypothetical protein
MATGMSVASTFASAQPGYAAMGIATFPFDATQEVKRGPLVRHYDRMGLRASRQMAMRFPDAPGLAAMAGARNRFTIIDVDERGPAGERLLADVQRQLGNSRFIVRTGSGGFHAYYRHNGEGRKIRPNPKQPIDVIGGGAIVLPPSLGFKGNYEIIHGRLDDLARLEPICSNKHADPGDLRSAREGNRDNKFWPCVARYAQLAKSLDDLIAFAREMNEMLAEPWSDTEVDSEIVKRCNYWWGKTQKGENRFGVGKHVLSTHALIDDLMLRNLDAYALLTLLKRHHWGRQFYFANAIGECLGWGHVRVAAARKALIDEGHVTIIRHATRHDPMLCKLGMGRK